MSGGMKASRFIRSLLPWLPVLYLTGAFGAAADNATPYNFTTLAGESSFGSADGLGSTARFAWPQGIAIDASGNLYVADADNSTIRKVTPAGLVTTFAGKAGYYATVDGTGSEARFNFPFGLALDHAGNLFVSELGSHVIRKVTPGGAVTTYAGLAGTSGSADGPAATARFNSPFGLVVDSMDNLYVAEMGGHTIRKITPAGVVSTWAGQAGTPGSADGTGTAARFKSPNYLAIDTVGFIYVSDTGNSTVRKISPAGDVTTLAGTAGQTGAADGTGPAASFGNLQGISVDAAGNVSLNDQTNHTVRKITPSGVVTTFAGTPGMSGSGNGTGSAARFYFPAGLVADTAGNLYTADSIDCTVRKISPAGEVTSLAGLGQDFAHGSTDGPGPQARFNPLGSPAVGPDGSVYTADPLNGTIRKVTTTGVVSTVAGTAGLRGSVDGTGSAARFYIPSGVAVDASGNVYVADSGNNTIRKITPSGVVTTLAGTAGVYAANDGTGPAAGFFYPYALAVDSGGTVYVAEVGNYTIRKVTPAGAVTTLAGQALHPGYVDGPGATALFSSPESIAVDKDGYVFVGDRLNNVVRLITPGGTVSTLEATRGLTGRVTVDLTGNLFVASTTIQKVTPGGAVTTIAGLAEAVGSADGTGSEARFNNPQGIAVDPAGHLFVTSDTTVRKGELAGPPLITQQPQSLTVTPGASVSFSIIASGVAPLTYQWFFNGTAFSGATSPQLNFASARGSDAGDYTVVVTNPAGTVTSNKATLVVSSTPAPPPPSSSGGGSGGGAMDRWFILALAVLAAARAREVHRRDSPASL